MTARPPAGPPRHPSYGVLSPEEFAKLRDLPLSPDAEMMRKGAEEAIKQRRKGGEVSNERVSP